MKVLVVHGSPHTGHTMKLTQKFEEAVKKCGDADFEYISVSQLNIDMCKGCFVCITRGEELCPLKSDDVQLVVKKMNEADGVIFSAPTYVYNIPALMKNLIDRLAYFGHRPVYQSKYAVVISTTCGAGLKESLRLLSFGTAEAWGFRMVGTLGANTHPFYSDKKSRVKLDKKITALAERFYKALTAKGVPPVRFADVMRFKAVSLHASYAREMFPADYRFYFENENVGKNYYLKSAKIGFLKMAASEVLSIPISRIMQKEKIRVDMQQKFLDW